nr:uncharacterized protein LOC128687233 [Cherax quadricarinatus]
MFTARMLSLAGSQYTLQHTVIMLLWWKLWLCMESGGEVLLWSDSEALPVISYIWQQIWLSGSSALPPLHTVRLGLQIEVRDAAHWTALHHASFEGRLQAVTLLLQAGADVNTADPHV